MDDERTWEQQQDDLDYKQWAAEQDWAEHNAATLDFETDRDSTQQDGLDAEREAELEHWVYPTIDPLADENWEPPF